MNRSLQPRESFDGLRPFVAHSDKYRDFLEKALQSRHRSASEWQSQSSKVSKYRPMGNFTKLKRVGGGAHSEVFLVQEKTTNAVYALKVISRETMQKYSSMLQEEIRILNKLRHRNITQLYHIFMDECGLNLVLQYGEESLFSYLKRKGKLPEEEAAQIISQVLSAIDELHMLGITHRDIKLQNILIVNGVVKLCDFGFAKRRKVFDAESELMGTMGYLSPEMVSSSHYSHKTDIWAAGVILYELATGRGFLEQPTDKEKYLYLKEFTPANLKLQGSTALKSFLRRIFTRQQLRPEAYELLRDPFLQAD